MIIASPREMLQDAFWATMQDADLLADAKRQKLEVERQNGPCLAAPIERIYAPPKPIVDRVPDLVK